MSDIVIKRVIVNKTPESCGECPLMLYEDENPVCAALPKEIREIQGNPYNMCYRRSDCVLCEDIVNATYRDFIQKD